MLEYAGKYNKLPQKEPPKEMNEMLVYVLVGILILFLFLVFCLKCAYDRNNNYLLMNLPESERKIYAAIVGI
jgi:uncharacterized integral membrane protein